MIENVESIVERAMQIADELPEKYQVAAFAELLRCALESATVSAEPRVPAHRDAQPPQPSDRSLEEGVVAGLPQDHRVKEGSRDQQTVWAVIKLRDDGLEATSTSVLKAIRSKLGVTPESPENTSRRLRGLTPRHLKRRKRKKGPGYAYTPTGSALELFEGLGEGAEE